MNYTSIEQSKRLVELGLAPETADMNYGNFCNKGLGYCDQFRAGLSSYIKEVEVYDANKKAYGIDKYDGVVAWDVLPCWSEEKLLELINGCTRCEIALRVDKRWNIFATKENSIFRPYDTNPKGYITLFAALYELVVWLLENKLV